MEGKTIEESKTAQRKAYDTKKSGPKPLKHVSKVPVTMKDNNGQAFIVMIDSSALNNAEAYMCEFAGLASDPLPSASIDEVEYEGWLATEEEFTTFIDWANNNTPVNKDAFAVTPLNQSQHTTISLNDTHSMLTQVRRFISHWTVLIFLHYAPFHHVM
ncbi:hypothetical protein L208DRAFT_1530918 [Tricholoma matsutake]|nr:hypothetical protein L208DRAFT_1530918 [Tricholoma matsutake 945]